MKENEGYITGVMIRLAEYGVDVKTIADAFCVTESQVKGVFDNKKLVYAERTGVKPEKESVPVENIDYGDVELKVLADVIKTFKELDEDSIDRILDYLKNRY